MLVSLQSVRLSVTETASLIILPWLVPQKPLFILNLLCLTNLESMIEVRRKSLSYIYYQINKVKEKEIAASYG